MHKYGWGKDGDREVFRKLLDLLALNDYECH